MPGPLLLNWLTTGGFAGVHRQTLLYADGMYTVSEEGEESRTGRIPAEDAATVRALLEEAELGRQPRRSTGPGADRFQYRIAYDGHVVHRDETTLGEPLRTVRDLLPVG